MSFFRIKNRVDEQQAAETVSSAAAENAVQTETFDDPGILCEELSFRRENETVYRRNDGTSRAVITSTPTHYFDKQTQSYRRIDNRLLDGGEMLETSENDVKVQLAKSAVQAKTMRLEKDGISVEWVYQPKTVTTRAAVSACVGSMNTSAVKASSDNSIRYEDIDENVDLEYSLLGSNVKENIVVKARGQQYRFDFRLKTNAFLRLSEDSRSIELCASGEADAPATFTIPSPFMYDARGERSDEVCYEVESQNDGEYRFTVVADAEWINSEEVVLPVTIDPQIISYDASFYSKTIYSKNLSSSTASWSIWSTSPVNGIKVQRDLYTEYKTTLTVYKSKFDLLDRKMIMAKLILTPKTLSQTGRIKVGDREYEVTSLNKVECDITKKMNDAGNTFTVDITAASYGLVNVVFEETGTNGPMLEIDYLTNENSIPQKMQFSGIARASTELDLLTRELTAEISDVKPGDSVAGVGISHVFKKSGKDFHCGANFRLNLNERLYRNDDDLLNANYIYEDAKGDKHGFKEYFYYLQAGVKTYVSKSAIMVELDGTLKHNGKEVFKEERSATGLQAVMQIEGVKNIENLEQRQKELIEIQSQMEAYEERLGSYMILTNGVGEILYRMGDNYKTEVHFNMFMDWANQSGRLLFTESEAYLFKSLFMQKESADVSMTSLSLQMDNCMYRLNHGNLDDEQRELCQEEYDVAYEQFIISNTDREEARKRYEYLEEQNDARIEQLKKYYKEYVNLVYQEQALRRQIPVNFLRSETLVKGFNEYGNLVAIYDGYENTVTVEWDEANQKILRVYDGEEKEIRFDYGDDGLLASITDARGRRVTYEYLSSGVKFTYANGKVLNATYDTQKNLNGVHSPDREAIAVSYANNRVYSLTHLSNASEIAHGVEPQTGLAVIASLAVADYQDGVKLTDQNGKVSVYVFNGDGNLSEYYVEEGGVIVQGRAIFAIKLWNRYKSTGMIK